MKKVYLKDLVLSNYRNFVKFQLNCGDNVLVITGKNGAGKTNVLEAISFLSPGKGIRSADLAHVAKDNQYNWHFAIEMESKLGIANIISSYDIQEKKRITCYNGSKISSNELTKFADILWLTPQMSNLFSGSRNNRLKFFDRIVLSFFHNHATILNEFDQCQKKRLTHLSQHSENFDRGWLTVLEKQIASSASLVHNNRLRTMHCMRRMIEKLDSCFPKAIIALTPVFISEKSDIEGAGNNFTSKYENYLEQNRRKDGYSGRTNFGIHLTDVVVTHQDRKQNAVFCSTGEQKAMLVSMFLAQIEAIIEWSAATPILLLDELFVHLDQEKKMHLARYIISRGVQTFITATDTSGIEAFITNLQLIEI